MGRILRLLLISCVAAVPPGASAEEPARGKFLVATENVGGPAFAKTVILLLHHDATGAVGLVVNRPTDAAPADALPDLAGIDRYDGKLYWGGPVEMYTVRALLRSDSPPEHAVEIIDGVHMVPLDEDVLDRSRDPTTLRFFVGYSGWAPGQLEQELRRDSWHVVAATEDLVFADEPDKIWRKLAPPAVYRASVEPRLSIEAR